MLAPASMSSMSVSHHKQQCMRSQQKVSFYRTYCLICAMTIHAMLWLSCPVAACPFRYRNDWGPATLSIPPQLHMAAASGCLRCPSCQPNLYSSHLRESSYGLPVPLGSPGPGVLMAALEPQQLQQVCVTAWCFRGHSRFASLLASGPVFLQHSPKL